MYQYSEPEVRRTMSATRMAMIAPTSGRILTVRYTVLIPSPSPQPSPVEGEGCKRADFGALHLGGRHLSPLPLPESPEHLFPLPLRERVRVRGKKKEHEPLDCAALHPGYGFLWQELADLGEELSRAEGLGDVAVATGGEGFLIVAAQGV